MLNKTVLALAISASLTSAAFAADKYQKYNFTNQTNVSQKSAEISPEYRKQIASTWLVKLNAPALSEVAVNGQLSNTASIKANTSIAQAQQSVINDIDTMSGSISVVAKTKNLISGIIIQGDIQSLQTLRANPSVSDILPIYDYELHVDESAKYMKGTALVEAGIATGKGIRVAVLDTGIDYTHAAFGGEGTPEAYAAATADATDTPVWPRGQIIGGYDFINSDPDPIDVTTNHGTHVSHSVLGLAPEAELYVYSVCSNVSCPGAAQLSALEAAMDPNGDGDISDRVDVINMSLGGDFGTTKGGAVQEMLDNAAKLGVISAISAGNDGATPFIIGGPSTTKSVMSVGAMTHPTTEATHVDSTFNGTEINIAPAGFNISNVFSVTSADTSLVYPDENQNGCVAFADGTDFTGKVVIIDRGACNFTSKVINAQDKGAEFVLIANHTAGAGAPGLGGSDDAVKIPSAGISLEDGQVMKKALEEGATINYSFVSTSVVQSGAIASFTSRGPSSDGYLKPEITAPGVNIDTAHPGLGTELSPISGTSFSSPMTAGAMALLREALPNRNAFEIKATLMNSANLDVTMEARSVNADAALAPISFIGAGLVDVEKASKLDVAAWDKNTKQAALAYGLMNLAKTTEFTKHVTIKNFSSTAKNYTLSLEERFANDMESGALSFTYPSTVNVPAGGSVDVEVKLSVDPSKLHEWTLDADKLMSPSGSDDLTVSEYDGALRFTDGDENFHLVYHLLPKASASVEVSTEITDEGVIHNVTNNGAVDFDTFTIPLTAKDEEGDAESHDILSGSIEVLEVPDTFCASGYSAFTTITQADGIISTIAAGTYADIDMDSDGTFDYTVQTLPYSAFDRDATPGLAVTFTTQWGSFRGAVGNVYFTSGNNFVTMQSCVESFGLAAADLGSVNASVRFRTSDSQFDFFEAEGADITENGNVNFAVSTELAKLVDAEDKEVEKLAVGESAKIQTTGQDFVMLANSGSMPLLAAPTQEAGVAPTVTPEQTFSVDENTANGTVIGKVMATDPDLFTSPVSEYIIESSSSVALMMERDGTLKVADSTLLDYDAGLTEIILEVTAIDSQGNASEAEVVMVSVNNLLDEASEQPAPPAPAPEPKKKSSGSTGIIALFLLPLALLRRRK